MEGGSWSECPGGSIDCLSSEERISQEAIQQAPAYQLLRDAMVDDMQAQLQKRTEEAATFTADEAAKHRKQGVWAIEVCMLPQTRVLRANIKVGTARMVGLDLYYEYRDANAKPSEYTLVLAKEMGAHHFRPGH